MKQKRSQQSEVSSQQSAVGNLKHETRNMKQFNHETIGKGWHPSGRIQKITIINLTS